MSGSRTAGRVCPAGDLAKAMRYLLRQYEGLIVYLDDVEPLTYLTDILQRIVSGRAKSHELHALLPWNWTRMASAPAAAA